VLAGWSADAMAQRRDADRRGGGRPELVLLGEKSVGFLVDRDVINIGQSEDWDRNRAFRGLHFVATGNDIHLTSIRIVCLNGFTEELRVDRLVRQGSDLPVDLRGERSFIRQIELIYRSRPSFKGQAVLKVFGEAAARPPGRMEAMPVDRWVE